MFSTVEDLWVGTTAGDVFVPPPAETTADELLYDSNEIMTQENGYPDVHEFLCIYRMKSPGY